MSRVHITSRQHVIQSERMDPWEHVQHWRWQTVTRPLRNRDHDQLLVWRWNFLDDDREWKNKYVTEMTEESQDDHIDDIGDNTGKLVAEARPKQTPSPTSSSPTIT